jgi:hypothetical protein
MLFLGPLMHPIVRLVLSSTILESKHTFDDYNAIFGVDHDNRKVLYGVEFAAHSTSHGFPR